MKILLWTLLRVLLTQDLIIFYQLHLLTMTLTLNVPMVWLSINPTDIALVILVFLKIIAYNYMQGIGSDSKLTWSL